jgi:hypothetical protein
LLIVTLQKLGKLSTNDKLFTKIAAAFGLWPDKVEGYAL